MRICIPIEASTPAGAFQFLAGFEAYLHQAGWTVTRDLGDGYDILFANSWHVVRAQVLEGLRRNPLARVIHRIDGVAADYGRQDGSDAHQTRVNRLADVTIFQSHYGRHAARERYRVIAHDGPVIHNPVDVERFLPDGPSHPMPDWPTGAKVVCVTWSTNPMKGAAEVYATARQNPDTLFVLCGRYPDAPEMPNVHPMGVLDREHLAAALRTCDLLLTYSRNEACPNHVLEGLASGLPVLYVDSGASAELVGDAGLPVTVDDFGDGLARIISDRGAWAGRARARALDRFAPDVVFPRYETEMTAAVARPPGRRALLSWAEVVSFARRGC